MSNVSNNVPAVYVDKAKSFASTVVGGFDKIIDKAIPIPFEKPIDTSIGTRTTHAGMGVAYVLGALGSFAPFGLSIIGDAIVGSAGAAAAAYGNKNGYDEIANQGRLAMQTGIVATGASAAGVIVPLAGWVNVGAYSRAAIKSFKAAFTGLGKPAA